MNTGNDFEGLVGRIRATTEVLQRDALVAINRSVTARAWLTGYYVVEYEQHGEDRAKYGERVLAKLAERLAEEKLTVPTLKRYRQLYKVYPDLAFPVADYLKPLFENGLTVSSQLELLPELVEPKRLTASILLTTEGKKANRTDELRIDPCLIFNRLSLSHIVELLHLDDDLQRTFYAFEALRGIWSVRELRRQIDSLYYIRSGWSKNPHKLSQLVQGRADKATLRETLRSPHVFEFLGLASKDVIEESDVEQGIIDHLKEFIMEMGLGFCWEARQQKILIDDRYEWVDLVFYHRILKCHVLIELKAHRLDHKDAAQLGVYLAYYRKHMMQPDDNPPIGILLCAEAGREMVEYVNTFVTPEIFISKYQLQLPDKKQMTAFLKEENGNIGMAPNN